jgi:CubicO group peptidase (beta-lactamase class C family)
MSFHHMYLRRRSLLSLIVLSSLLPCAQAQEILDLKLTGSAVIDTQPGLLYQVMKSPDMQAWLPHGSWIVGDGTTHTVEAPLNGEATYLRVEASPLANLNASLETLRASSQVPGMAAAVFQDGRLTGIGAVGKRRFGTDAPVTLNDLWHHGSMTKSMTATLAAMMVKDGVISWTTTLGEVFPQAVSSMAANWSGVTLKQLLANASGAPGDLSASGIWTQLWNFNGLPVDARKLLLNEVTSRPLRFTPGTGYEYSNAGFALAGHMLETVAGKPWETLMQERFFSALGIASGGTGVPATPRHLDHPVGHSGNAANPTIWDPGTSADNPPAIGPAATVHMNIADMARYAEAHLRGAVGGSPSPLSATSWETLHSRAYGNNYALGWGVHTAPWAGGDFLQHTGSNTQWYSAIWIAPEINWACVVCINFGGTNAGNTVDGVSTWLFNNYGP